MIVIAFWVTVAFWLAVEFYLLAAKKPTLTERLYNLIRREPYVIFLVVLPIGVLLGHFFWCGCQSR